MTNYINITIIVFLILARLFGEFEDYIFNINNPIFKTNYEIIEDFKKTCKDKTMISIAEYSNFCLYILESKFHFETSNELLEKFKKEFDYIFLITSGDKQYGILFNEFFNAKNEFLRYDIVEKIVNYKLERNTNE